MMILEKGMDSSGTMDWEKTICLLMDKMVESKSRESQLRHMEEVINEVEDLVLMAYYLGSQNKKD